MLTKLTDKSSDARAAEAESHKQDALRAQKEGKGHWKEELASDGESSVKAERQNKDEDPESLMKKTEGEVAERHGQK